MKRAELVAVGIADVSEVHRAERAVAKAGRILARRPPIRNRDVVELLHLLRRIALEADGAAVRCACRFAVDRLGDAEGSAVMAIEESRMA